MADGCIELYSGNDDQVLPILSLGGLGVISVLSNVAPKETHDKVMKFLEGDTKGAAEIQLKAIPLIHALFSDCLLYTSAENDKEPRLILVQGVGAFIMEDDKGKAAKVQLLVKDAIKLAVYAESFGGDVYKRQVQISVWQLTPSSIPRPLTMV